MTRRHFTLMSSLTLASGSALKGAEAEPTEVLSLGLLTDVHYADKKTWGSRAYRDSLLKGKEAAEFFKEKKPAAMVCLGDLIDAAPSVEIEISYLTAICKVLDVAGIPRHHVLGNHCVATLNKEEFFKNAGSANKEGHYSFDLKGNHFVVLDACYNSRMEPYGRNNFVWHDSNMTPEEIAWLKKDLAETKLPTVVFTHQRLDVDRPNKYAIKQSVEVRKILEDSGRVRVVFQGHSHKNELEEVNGIPYCTLAAMVEGEGIESNSYSLLRFLDDGSIKLEGYRRQKNQSFSRKG
ncbi:metallophosphoesterase [Akkermansiaceae bacterium]|jgi:alkaline phosphatase|nr:metallophosphoesterase [Akkermansiaceae bacterium]MDB4509645.1 metallophosphoesterase [Akkermansiaceae bacterium]MDF1711591.1 metallophosphoesterase [Akkermansiaceae bacterium]